jgi:WhiB family transcriptional regulator, redox-sensing transcriptional regulator
VKLLDTGWHERARCKGADPELFFTKAGQHADDAKALCRTCPVRPECLEEALALSSTRDFGIRGGLSQKERHAIRKARRAAETRLSA